MIEYDTRTPAQVRANFICRSCGTDTHPKSGIQEYYMVNFDIWEVVGNPPGMLCVGCLEDRLGRRLTPLDFLGCPLNLDLDHHRSPRLLGRESVVVD